VVAAQLGVGGHGQLPLPAGGLPPAGPVGHDGGEHRFAFPVGVMHGLVADGQRLLPGGLLVIAVAAGGGGFRGAAQRGQTGVAGGGDACRKCRP
jgi:hypothetical protein